MLYFMENRPVKAELFHAGERTDKTKLIVAFRYSANARKNAVNSVTHIHKKIKAFNHSRQCFGKVLNPVQLESQVRILITKLLRSWQVLHCLHSYSQQVKKIIVYSVGQITSVVQGLCWALNSHSEG
jgi:hypothetical protein